MDDETTPIPDAALERARYGKKHDGDRFVGFWLALVMEGRQYGVRPNFRQTRKVVEHFLMGRDMQAATASAGQEAVNDQLRDGARVYFASCLTDPQYSNTLWRTNRIEPVKLRSKMARDAANTLALLADSDVLVAVAAQLPTLLTEGFLGALAPAGAEELSAAVAANPSAVRAMELAAGQ